MNQTDRKLIHAKNKSDNADARALLALKLAMPAGRYVSWMHGQHERMGEVIGVIGFAFYHAKVRVKSVTSGKVMDVTAGSIIDRL